MKPPYVKQLGTIAGLRVFLVDGAHVRNHIDIDFTMGGNEAIYPQYNPAGEIWIDDAAGWLDRNATTLHEIVERHQMMTYHKGYDEAHDVASAVERPFREELAKAPPRGFDTSRVSAAYRRYLANPTAPRVNVPRPNDRPKSGRELDREISTALGRRTR